MPQLRDHPADAAADLEHRQPARSIGEALDHLTQDPVAGTAPETAGFDLGGHVEALARVVGAVESHRRRVAAKAVDLDERGAGIAGRRGGIGCGHGQ